MYLILCAKSTNIYPEVSSMKISMWMIVEKMEKYHPKYSIVDGTACITGVRFISDEGDTSFQPQYVYLYIDNSAPFSYNTTESATLCNGRDMIILQGRDTNEILNDLLAVFDFYNSWEKSLWEASAHKSFQQIIDLGDRVLNNPMMVSDMDGNVLAMSTAYVDDDINEYWTESRNSGHVPTAILGAPMRTTDGNLSSWTDTPAVYILPDGTKTIGSFLSLGGQMIAGFGLWEYKKPIIPGDIWLVQVLYEVLLSTLEAPQRSAPQRSSSAILEDLLAGVQVDDDLLRNLEQKTKRPWQLLVIDNPFRSDVIHQRNLVQRLQRQEHPCVPLMYENHVVALTSAETAQSILRDLLGSKEKQYYLAGISLPMEDLRMIPSRYVQTAFAIKSANEKPGIYQMENFALQYLMSLHVEQNQQQALIHPALAKLKQYDREKNSELYDTLYLYLLNERSVLQSAQAMHVHKNSLMYRLQRIQSIIDVNLDDPMTRIYLLLSYMMEDVYRRPGAACSIPR